MENACEEKRPQPEVSPNGKWGKAMPIQCSYGPALRTLYFAVRSNFDENAAQTDLMVDASRRPNLLDAEVWSCRYLRQFGSHHLESTRRLGRWAILRRPNVAEAHTRHDNDSSPQRRSRSSFINRALTLDCRRFLAATSLRTRRSGHSFCFILYAIDAELSRFSSLSRKKINCASVAPIVHSFIISIFCDLRSAVHLSRGPIT